MVAGDDACRGVCCDVAAAMARSRARACAGPDPGNRGPPVCIGRVHFVRLRTDRVHDARAQARRHGDARHRRSPRPGSGCAAGRSTPLSGRWLAPSAPGSGRNPAAAPRLALASAARASGPAPAPRARSPRRAGPRRCARRPRSRCCPAPGRRSRCAPPPARRIRRIEIRLQRADSGLCEVRLARPRHG